jgi:hypothetical protein
MTLLVEKSELLKKKISDETKEEIRALNLQEFAIAMGDELTRVGQWHMAYKNGGERTSSVGINPIKRRWQDFTRQGVGGSDALSYYAYRTYDDTSLKDRERFVESCIQVCRIAGIPVKFKDGTTLEPDSERRVSQSLFVPQNNKEDAKGDDAWLNYYYRHLMDQLDLSDKHRENLMQFRGFSAREIAIRGYRSVMDNARSRYKVTKDLINLLKEYPEGVPGFALIKRGNTSYWSLIARNGFLIPFRNLWNQVVGFQLRVDEPRKIRVPQGYTVSLNDGQVSIYDKLTEELVWTGVYDDFPVQLERGKAILVEGAKYLWLSTSTNVESGILKGARIGHPTPPPYHVAVPSSVLEKWEPGDLISDVMNMDTTEVWWGEGPLKGDIAADLTEGIHLQVAGVANYRQLFEPTLQLNPRRIIIAFDSDAQTKEEDVGKTVLQCIEEAKELFLPKGVELFCAAWSPKQAKGLDDLLRIPRQPHYLPLGGDEYPYVYYPFK